MARSPLVSLIVFNLFVCASGVWAAARFEAEDGQLAIRTDEKSEWKVLNPSDVIPARCRLKTSPLGAVWIKCDDRDLYLGADSEADLDVGARQITVVRGRTRLVSQATAKEDWRCTSGDTIVVCHPGSEFALVVADKQPELNLLVGNAHVQRGKNDPREHSAPDPMAEGIEKWRRQIRSTTEVRPSQGLGQLVTNDAQSDSPVRLDVQQYHVNVVLKPPVALVQIDQSFFNPYPTQQEGTFVFNLPSGASVSRFAMYVTPDSLIEGELIERRRAAEVYTTIVRSKRDPAILEQIGTNLFRMRVFPIFARDTKRILLDFTVPLVVNAGQYRFQLPLMSDQRPIQNFSLRGTIHPPFVPESIRSATHPEIQFADNNGTVTFQSIQNTIKPPSYFTLNYQAPANLEPTIRTYREPTDNERFFAVTIPNTSPARALPESPCDLLLLLETSGNANLSRARKLARTVISGMSPVDRLQIGCVDVNYRPMTTDWCRSNGPEAGQALERLREQIAMGANDLATSLRQARTVFTTSPADRRRIIVYIGDGPSQLPTPLADPQTLPAQQPADAPFFAITSSASPFLSAESVRTGGALFNVAGINAASEGHDLFQWTLSRFPSPHLVRSVKIEGVESEDLIYDRVWPRGGELQISGKSPPQDVLQITLTTDAGEHQFHVDCRERQDDDLFTGRLWAQRKVDSLLLDTEMKVSERDPAIVLLCQEWSLMSPLTAFLVLETEQDYVLWKIDRKIRRRYWKPAGSDIARVDVKPPKSVATKPATSKQLTAKQVARIIDQAELKLANDNPDGAQNLLRLLEGSQELTNPDVVEDLQQRIKAKLLFKQRLAELSAWHPLIDRRIAEPFVVPRSLLTQFSYGGVTQDFLNRHPHALRLLRKVDDLIGSVNVFEFAMLIRERTGLPVVVDRVALQDDGIDSDLSLDLDHLGGLTLRSFLKEVLEPHGLRCIPERHLLRITTKTRAEEKFIAHVYPVDDLLPGGPLPSPHRLANPYFDTEEAARKRIEAKLKKPISVHADIVPLSDVLKQIGDKIDLHARIDDASLRDQDLSELSNLEVSVELPNLPAGVVLEELLEPIGLTTMIENECLKIVSKTKSSEILETRLYSLMGLEDRPIHFESADRHPGRGMAGMGGFGGFGGMGGFGGGGMGGPGIGNPAPPANEKPHLMESFDISSPSTDLTGDPVADVDDETPANPLTRLWESGIQKTLQQATTGHWMAVDFEGGAMVYVPSSHSLLVQQSQQAHSEIAQVLDQQRQLISPRQALNNPLRNHVVFDTDHLQDILEQSMNAKWMYLDQEGGSITRSTKDSLTILQPQRVHEEIDRIFTQIRRSRIISETSSSRTSWEGIDDLSTIDFPSVTPFPRNSVMPRSEKRDDEMQWLASRKAADGINQRWRSTATQPARKTEFHIRRHASRLELTLPHLTLRCDGPNAIVVHPGMALGEINDWAEAARLQADFALPWLPHRSNDELASLFDISRVSEDANQVTLHLGFPGTTDSYLETTISKATGQPLKWVAVVNNKPQFELRFEPRQVVAVDPQGAVLERWELLADDAPQPIPALNEGWQAITLVTIGDPTSTYTQARQALKQADAETARKLLTDSIKEQPQQPLLHFLLAWVDEFSDQKSPANLEARKSALRVVAASSAGDLIRSITRANFPSLGEKGFVAILQMIPEEHRPAQAFFALAEHTRDSGHIEQALGFVDHALRLENRPAERTRIQILQIELLLRSQQLQRAMEIEKSLTDLTDDQLIEVARLFALAKADDVTDRCYNQLRQRTEPSGLALAYLFEDQAELYPHGKRRWELLLAAHAAVPKSERHVRRFIDRVLDEAKDTAIINSLAADQKEKKVRYELKMLEAKLEKDEKRVADLVDEIETSHGIQSDRVAWALHKLQAADRPLQIVNMLEARIKRGEQLEPVMGLILAKAYQNLGRDTDAQRAASHPVRYTTQPTSGPNNPRPGSGNGTGFFSVK